MRLIRGIGRYIFALTFIGFGIIHLIKGDNPNFVHLVPGFMPVPAVWVYVTGISYILAAISIMTERLTALACTLLGLLLFLIAVTVHILGMFHASGQAAIYGQLINFFKAMAIGGGAWVIAGSYGTSKRGVVTQEGPGVGNSGDIASENRENKV